MPLLDLPKLNLDFTKANKGTKRRGDSLRDAMKKIQAWADAGRDAIDNANLPINLSGNRVLYGQGTPTSDTGLMPGDVYIDVTTGDVYAG